MDGEPPEVPDRSGPRPGDGRSERFDAQDLIETIRAVAAERRSGTLTVTERSGRRCHICFREGLVKMVDAGEPEHDSLEEALLGSRTFSRTEVDEARRAAQSSGKSLAQALLERGAARGLKAQRLMDLRSRREAGRLASWKIADCRFRDAWLPHSGAEPYAHSIGGGVDAEKLIVEVLRAGRRGR